MGEIIHAILIISTITITFLTNENGIIQNMTLTSYKLVARREKGV
jgi:hypothetical protein